MLHANTTRYSATKSSTAGDLRYCTSRQLTIIIHVLLRLAHATAYFRRVELLNCCCSNLLISKAEFLWLPVEATKPSTSPNIIKAGSLYKISTKSIRLVHWGVALYSWSVTVSIPSTFLPSCNRTDPRRFFRSSLVDHEAICRSSSSLRAQQSGTAPGFRSGAGWP